MTTQAGNLSFDVHAIDRENFDLGGRDRAARRHSFVAPESACVHHRNDLGLVHADDCYAGVVATVSTPAGSRLVEVIYGDETEDTVLAFPDGTTWTAEDAINELGAAR